LNGGGGDRRNTTQRRILKAGREKGSRSQKEEKQGRPTNVRISGGRSRPPGRRKQRRKEGKRTERGEKREKNRSGFPHKINSDLCAKELIPGSGKEKEGEGGESGESPFKTGGGGETSAAANSPPNPESPGGGFSNEGEGEAEEGEGMAPWNFSQGRKTT